MCYHSWLGRVRAKLELKIFPCPELTLWKATFTVPFGALTVGIWCSCIRFGITEKQFRSVWLGCQEAVRGVWTNSISREPCQTWTLHSWVIPPCIELPKMLDWCFQIQSKMLWTPVQMTELFYSLALWTGVVGASVTQFSVWRRHTKITVHTVTWKFFFWCATGMSRPAYFAEACS